MPGLSDRLYHLGITVWLYNSEETTQHHNIHLHIAYKNVVYRYDWRNKEWIDGKVLRTRRAKKLLFDWIAENYEELEMRANGEVENSKRID